MTVPVAASIEPVPVIGRQSGHGARRVQERLLELGFWLQAANGDYGVTTRQAVMAFQKYRGLEPNESVDEATAAEEPSVELKTQRQQPRAKRPKSRRED